MNKNHLLEWYHQPEFNWEKDCKIVELTKDDLTHDRLHEICGDYYEIQRALVEMEDGYSIYVQSSTKNKVNITPRYVTLAESQKRKSNGVFQYKSFTCRREFVKRLRIWLCFPPKIRINRRPDPADQYIPNTMVTSDGYIQHFDND